MEKRLLIGKQIIYDLWKRRMNNAKEIG